MTAEVEFILSQLAAVVDDGFGEDGYGETEYGGISVPVRRINRDDSDIMDGGTRSRSADLGKANYIGVSLEDRSTEPTGTNYENRIETIVGVRVEGLTREGGNYGHIDPDGTEGVPFDVLVDRARRAALADRCYPDVGRPNTTYHTLFIQNERPDSSAYSDYYRYDFEIRFRGYEDLP